MILYSVASPPLTLTTYPFSHYVMCIAGCVVRRHLEATLSLHDCRCLVYIARRAGSDSSMSASGSAGPGFYPRRGSKFSFENFHLKIFNLGARRGGDVHFLIARLYITCLD